MTTFELRFQHVIALALAIPACHWNHESTDNCPDESTNVQLQEDVACAVAKEATGEFADTSGAHSIFYAPTCDDVCNDAGPYSVCIFPASYEPTLLDGGAVTYEGQDAGDLACPKGPVTIQCAIDCTGRRTAGVAMRNAQGPRDAAEYFAASAYLEAVSAVAFARLARELDAHGAPAELVDACRAAEAEEIRHTELTSALANGYAPSSDPKVVLADERMRSLFEIAMENAVEGCVRETYGAALAVLRARRARDPRVRDALEIIAHDECGHALLSWQIAEWASTRLTEEERQVIEQRTRIARRELLRTVDDGLGEHARLVVGMPSLADQRRLAALLDAHFFAEMCNSIPRSNHIARKDDCSCSA